MTGFEGAASLPYSGCVAINALNEAGILECSLEGKHVLVQDGCSPVGCVLMQLCKHNGATITATCDVRSVPVVKALGESKGSGIYSKFNPLIDAIRCS